MNHSLDIFGISHADFSVATVATEFALNWFLQSTLLIVAGLCLANWFRNKGSAAQSLIYRTTLAAVLVCPLATWTLGQLGVNGWSVRLPQVASLEGSEIGDASAEDKTFTVPDVSPSSGSSRDETVRSIPSNFPEAFPNNPTTSFDSPRNSVAEVEVPKPIYTTPNPSVADATAPSTEPSTAGDLTWLRTLAPGIAACWLITTAILLTRLVAAWWRLSRLVRVTHPANTQTHQLCEEIATAFGVKTPDVRCSPFLSSPCLTGFGLTRRSTVLLPEDQLDLPLRDVLVHELAHLHRRDVHWNFLIQVATAIYFFQPLLWILSRRIEFSAEEVCDDFVVEYGGDRERYAHQLVDIAEHSTEASEFAGAAAVVGIVSLRSMLARRVERIMDGSRELSTRVGRLQLLLILLVGLAGTAVVGLVGLNANTIANETTIIEPSESEVTLESTPALVVKIRGRVVDEKDRPIAGATVKAIRSRYVPYKFETREHDSVGRSQADESGQFEIGIPPVNELPEDVGAFGKWGSVDLIATAPGYALNWRSQDEKANENGDHSLEIRLTKDPSPLVGKLLWPDGTPAVGVEVNVKQLTDTVSDDVKEWLAGNRSTEPENPYPKKASRLIGKQHPALPAKVRTNDSGSFEIAGISPLHSATLQISGRGAMDETLSVLNHAMKPFQMEGGHFYGTDFVHSVTRGVAIQGNVVDADTGEPIGGVKVAPSISYENGVGMNLGIRAETDARGHFRIGGLPPTTKNFLRMTPAEDQPYLVARDLKVPESDGQQPLTMNIKLRRGVFVRGKVTNSVNGKPVEANVVYFPFKSNENAKRYERYKTDKNRMLAQGEGVATNANGEFTVVAIPGGGILATNAKQPQEWRAGFGAEEITGFRSNEHQSFDTYDHCTPRMYNGLAEVDIPKGVTDFPQDLQVDRGGVVRLRPVDHAGTPLLNVEVLHGSSLPYGISISSATKVYAKADIEISALRPDEKRQVILRQREQGLACFATVQVPLEKTAEPTVHDVILKPCAVVTGKLIDESGKPIEGKRLYATGGVTTSWRSQVEHLITEKDGSFRFEELVPGGTYKIASNRVYGSNQEPLTVATDLKLEAGETVNFGEIDNSSPQRSAPVRTKSPDPTIRALARENAKSDNQIAGVVVGADGKRVAGAKFYWMASRSYELESIAPKLVATSNDEGEFTFANPSLNLAPDAPATWGYLYYVVVRAPGHGFSVERPGNLLRKSREEQTVGVSNATRGVKGAVVSLPASGNPLRGRIIDVDGNGVADATVRINWFHGDGLDTFGRVANNEGKFADSTTEQWTGHINSLINIIEPPQAVDVFPMTTTDSEGRFELRDAGADRLFQLFIQGERIEFAKIIARNQPGEKINVTSDYYRQGETYVVHSQEILHVAGPSVPVEGRVVDFDTDDPIAGALVRANRVHRSDSAIRNSERQFSTHTDENGRYKITGLPLGNSNQLMCICREGETPYPIMGSKADTSKSKDVLQHDIRMKRGVWAEGRVFDGDTKKPMAGSIAYYFFRNPELLKELPGIRYTHVQWPWWTNRDGYFRVPVFPTRGILAYQHHPISHEEAMKPTIDRYPRGQGATSIKGIEERLQGFPTFPSYVMANNFQRLIEIDPDGSEDSVDVKMPLVKSQKLFARPVWPDGVSVSEYQAYGGTDWGWKKIRTPEFEIKGLKAGEQRKVFVYQRERNLVGTASVAVSDGQPVPTKIEVQTAGTIIGRLLDADGQPLTDIKLHWPYESSDDLRAGIWAPQPGKRRNPSQIELNKDGRFRLTGIVPGMQYTASATANRKMFTARIVPTHIGNAFSDVTVKAGETKDLGEIRADAKGLFNQGDAK